MQNYSLSNTSAKNYHNQIIYYVKIIVSQRWDVFEPQCSLLPVVPVFVRQYAVCSATISVIVVSAFSTDFQTTTPLHYSDGHFARKKVFD